MAAPLPYKLIPLIGDKGNTHEIIFTIFQSQNFNIQISAQVIDVVLKRLVNDSDDKKVLIQLQREALNFLTSEDCILYFYCDHAPIDKSERNKHLSNQEFRSYLFNSLFEKERNKFQIKKEQFGLHVRNIHIPDKEHGDHFISLVSTENNLKDLEVLVEEIISINEK